MANIAVIFLFSSLILGIHCSPTSDPSLVSLDQTALQALLIPFREAILHRVAVDWNHTLSDSERLTADLHVCSDKIKAAVQTCEYCTEAACKSTETTAQVTGSATFKDYLKFAAAIVNPLSYLQEPLNEIGDTFGDLKDLLGDGSDAFIESMSALGNSVGGKFSDAFDKIESAFNSLGGSLTGIGNTAIGGIKDVAGSVGGKLSDVGHSLQDLGHSVLHSIGGIFGKRQTAAIHPHIQQCMQQCASCDALLLPSRRQMVTKVCGGDVVQFNDTVRHNVATVKSIYTAVADKNHPIMVDVKYDPSSSNGILINSIYVTVNVKGRYVTYHSNVHYNMMNIGITAQELALEYWSKWTA